MTSELAKKLKAEAEAMEASERTRSRETRTPGEVRADRILETVAANLAAKGVMSESAARRAVGLGAKPADVKPAETGTDEKKLTESMTKSFTRMGLSEKGAKVAAEKWRG